MGRLKGHEPKDSQTRSASPLILIKKAPTVASACIVVGSVDLALISLLPAMITRTPEAAPILALIIVPAMAIGATILQYPIAIIADKPRPQKSWCNDCLCWPDICQLNSIFFRISVNNSSLGIFRCRLGLCSLLDWPCYAV